MKSMSIKPETLPKIKSSEVESFDSNNILYKLEFEGDISVEFMVMRNDRFGTFVKGKN